MKTFKKALKLPNPIEVLQNRGFKSEDIKHIQEAVSTCIVLETYEENGSDVFYDDIEDRKVLLYIRDLVWKYEDGSQILIRKDNVGNWCQLLVPGQKSYSCC